MTIDKKEKMEMFIKRNQCSRICWPTIFNPKYPKRYPINPSAENDLLSLSDLFSGYKRYLSTGENVSVSLGWSQNSI